MNGDSIFVAILYFLFSLLVIFIFLIPYINHIWIFSYFGPTIELSYLGYLIIWLISTFLTTALLIIGSKLVLGGGKVNETREL